MNAILGWLTSPEWAQVVKTLLHSLWQAGLVALVLGLLLRRIANPAWRYRFALGSLGGVLIAAVVSWAVLNQLSQRPETFPQTVLLPDASLAEQGSLAPDPTGEPIVFRVAATKHTSGDSVKAGWTAWLALVWILGALAMVVRAGVQVAGAERLRRSCKPLADERVLRLLEEAQRAMKLARRVRVAVTDKLTSPAVVGVLVPTLILPLTLLTALTPEQLRFVLLHELAHIRRGDYFANLFQLLMEALLFFNPAVWWISHLVRREREACCDALAIELSGAPVDYAKTLVQVAENVLSPAPAAATAFGDGQRETSSLSDRVQRLLVPGYRPALRLTWRAMLAALLVGGALLFLSAMGARNVVGAVANNANESAVKSEDKSGIDQQTTFTRPGDSTNITVTDSLNGKSPLEFTYPFRRTNRTQQSNGSIVTLNGLDSFATPELDPSVGMNSWKVSGRDQLQRQWFWYRAPSPGASVSTTNAVVSSPFGVETDLSKHLGLGSNRSDVILSGSFMTVVPSYLNSNNVSESIDKAEIEIEGGNAVRDLEGRLTAVTNGVRVKFASSGVEFTAESVQFNPITGNMIAAGNIRAETKDGTRIQGGNINWFSETNNIAPRQRVRIRLKDEQIIEFPEPTGIPPQSPPDIKSGSTNSISGKNGSTALPRQPTGGKMPVVESDNTSETNQAAASRSKQARQLLVSSSGDPVPPLYKRMFKIEPSTLYPLLGLQVPNQTNSTASSFAGEVSERLREWFENRGLDLQPPKTLFFNERLGQFLVHAPMKELGEIESLVQALKLAPQMINIKASFIEVPAEQMQSVLQTVFTNAPDPGTNQFMETLSEARTEALLRALKSVPGVDVVSCPAVTTFSGRQAQLQAAEVKTPGSEAKSVQTNGAAQVVSDAEPMSFGPMIDVFPMVATDGHTINMTVTPVVKEFVGFDEPPRFYDSPVTPRQPQQLEGRALASDLPAIGSRGGRSYGVIGATRPTARYRVRRVTTPVSVWDGQTVLFGNIPSAEITRLKDKLAVLGVVPEVGRFFRSEAGRPGRKQLIVLITPTIVDPAGNRVYPGVQADGPNW